MLCEVPRPSEWYEAGSGASIQPKEAVEKKRLGMGRGKKCRLGRWRDEKHTTGGRKNK